MLNKNENIKNKNYEEIKFNLEERVKKLPKRNDIDDKIDNYECSACRDVTFLLNDDGEAYPCKCREKVLLNLRLKKSSLSNILKGKTFANYIPDSKSLINAKTKTMDYCVEFIKDKEYDKSFLLSGKSGTGKTHLGVAIVINLIENNISCVYLDYIKFITEIRQSKYDIDKYNKIISEYKDSAVLCIDDFLKGRIEQGDINYVFELVNYRYQNMKPTIITTEKTVKELFAYDEALASRLIEMCGGLNGNNIVTFEDKYSNYRLRD